jgi:hypothetical protein
MYIYRTTHYKYDSCNAIKSETKEATQLEVRLLTYTQMESSFIIENNFLYKMHAYIAS